MGNAPEENFSNWKFWKTRRYTVVFLAFFGFFNVYSLRVNLSIAIVAMTENKTVVLENGTTIYQPEFEWNSELQGYILSSYFYGYVTTQVIGGYLAARVGGSQVFGATIGVVAFLTILTPWIATINVYMLIAVRALEGIFQGLTFPCMHEVWSKWAPPLERSRMANFAFSGTHVGTVVSMAFSAFLCEAFGWPSVFYFFGILGLIWSVIWLLVVKKSPHEDDRISKAELIYISEALEYNPLNDEVTYPWKRIFTSMPVWAIIFSHFSEGWGNFTMLTQLPKYMKDALNFNLGQTGILSALPYVVMATLIPICGHIADWLRANRYMTTTQVRKLFNCGGLFGQTVFLLAAIFWITPVGTIISMTFAVGLGALCWSGYCVNHLDVAPQHASVLFGIGNCAGAVTGIISPILTGYIVKTPTIQEWHIIFYITSGIYIFGCTFYAIFASGELQPWAVTKNDSLAREERLEEVEKQPKDNKNLEQYM